MTSRFALALLLALPALAGCASDSGRSEGPCAGVDVRGESICAPTIDGWAIRGTARVGGVEQGAIALLVHGLNETRASYEGLAGDLLPKVGGVVTFDLRGHGESTRKSGAERSWESFAHANEFRLMSYDVDAVVREAKREIGDRPLVLVGASIGANLALRWGADHAGDALGVVTLSPGLDYRGINVEIANGRYDGRVLFVASEDDAYSAESARSLDAKSAARVHELKVWQDKGHGTRLLDGEGRAFVVAWLSSNVL